MRQTGFSTEHWSFQDVLIHQLAAEIEELIARGLHHDYERTAERLASPRGQIEFERYLVDQKINEATLPCIHHPRVHFGLLNRVLFSALHLCTRRTDDLELRVRLRRLSQAMQMEGTPLDLTTSVLRSARHTLDRRTSRYEPALTLIELLFQSEGLSLEDTPAQQRLTGFLFDMNPFFQRLLSRFLHEYLTDYVVQDEYRLRGMLAYDPVHNPRSRQAPTPRPDFVVLKDGEAMCLLDAKYRDLWDQSLPREMLYQLAIYALSQRPDRRKAAILYPTMDASAVDQVVTIREPIRGAGVARVIVRPLNLMELHGILSALPSISAKRKAVELASRLAFGDAT